VRTKSVNLNNSTHATEYRDKKETKNEAPTLYTNTSQSPAPIEPVTLLPGTKWVHVLELDLEVLDEWLIEIDVTFKSPGTGKPLNKKHECCIYLLDQVTFLAGYAHISIIHGSNTNPLSTSEQPAPTVLCLLAAYIL